MKDLFFKCQKIVLINTKVTDKETVDLLAASILALLLNRGHEILEKIPEILNNTIIISDDRSVLEVEHQDLKNFKEDDELRYACACVTRKFSFNHYIYKEDRYLIIPKNSIRNNPIETIEKTTHELIHLLRFSDAERDGDNLLFKEGIATKTVNLKTETTYRRYFVLEEAIVQESAKRAIKSLLEYTEEMQHHPMFCKMNISKHTYKSNIYDAHVRFLEQFMEDEEFKRLVDETYTSSSPKQLSRYYNNVMDDNSAFSRLSNYYNKMDQAIDSDNVNDARTYALAIKNELNIFKKHNKNLIYV